MAAEESWNAVVDTSVLVEYIDEESPYRELVEGLLSSVKNGSVVAYITTVTAAEIVYVAYRLYEEAGSDSPDSDAVLFLEWLLGDVGFKTLQPSVEDAILAGEIKRKYRIALPDCFVIAAARRLGAKAVFLKVERELESRAEEFRNMGVVFLEEAGWLPWAGKRGQEVKRQK